MEVDCLQGMVRVNDATEKVSMKVYEKPRFSPGLAEAFRKSYARATSLGHCTWGTRHLLLLSVAPLLISGLTIFLPVSIWAHGGGLDGFGCHNDRKHGGYHCHRGLLAGEMFTSQHEMMAALKALQAKKKTPPASNQSPAASPNDKGETCIRDRHSGEVTCGDIVAH